MNSRYDIVKIPFSMTHHRIRIYRAQSAKVKVMLGLFHHRQFFDKCNSSMSVQTDVPIYQSKTFFYYLL